MGDNGLQLSYQLQSHQDSRVATVNYTLHVVPPSEGEPPACCNAVFNAYGCVISLHAWAYSVHLCRVKMFACVCSYVCICTYVCGSVFMQVCAANCSAVV